MSRLNPELLGIARHLLTFGGGLLVTKGVLSADIAQQIVSVILALVGVFWSVSDKRQPPAETVTPIPPTLLPQHPTSPPPPAPPSKGTPPVVFAPTLSPIAVGSGFMLSADSRKALAGVHPLLVKVIETAIQITPIDFKVTEGLRDEARQQQLLAAGKSWVKRSKHQDGLAVDLIALPDGKGSWEWEHYVHLNEVIQEAAMRCHARVTWGGSWKVRDGVHFQLEGV